MVDRFARALRAIVAPDHRRFSFEEDFHQTPGERSENERVSFVSPHRAHVASSQYAIP
jgi:hypothetical protein